MKKLLLVKLVRLASLMLAILFLSGCQVELFSAVSEQEANEMVAVLLNNGLDVDKVSGKKGTAQLFVAKADMAQAISLLKDHGYPKENFNSLGSVFTKEGLISSPLEERARYIYAVSQELSETLTNLDGVLKARVHVVLPEVDSTGEMTNPSSASVFIKYTEDNDLDGIIPQIKLLVNNSIEGLDYNRISVTLFPSKRVARNTDGMNTVMGIPMSSASAQRFYFVLAVCVGLIIIIGVGVVFYMVRSGKLILNRRNS